MDRQINLNGDAAASSAVPASARKARTRTRRRFAAVLSAMFVLIALSGLLGGWPGGAEQVFARESPATGKQSTRIEMVDLASLPPQVKRTLALIRAGGPFPYSRDGIPFGNRERLLPRRSRDYYTEYTVPTPGARNRGARRIIAGGDPTRSGEYYYTDDHYESFRRIRMGDE